MGDKTAINPRDEVMQRILEQNKADRPEGIPVDTPEIEPEDDGSLTPDEQLLSSGVVTPDEADKLADDKISAIPKEEPVNGDVFLTLKVGGKEIPLSRDEAIRRLQVSENADKKTQQAVLAKRYYEKRVADLDDSNKSIQPDDKLDDSEIKSRLVNATEKIYDGDLEEGAEALAEAVLARTGTTGISADEVRQIVKEETKTSSIKDSYQTFRRNDKYKHLLSDPYLANKLDDATVILQEDSEFMSTNPSYDEIFEKAGDMTQEWVDGLSRSAKVDPLQDRAERKRSSPSSVQSRSAKRSPEPEVKPRTRADILKEMAEARGQTYVP